VIDGRIEPGTQRRPPPWCRSVHDPRWSGGPRLVAPGPRQPQGVQTFECAVDELARQPPRVADRRARTELSGDVVAVSGAVGEDAEHRPLVERQVRRVG
jgi:hypothetical protein